MTTQTTDQGLAEALLDRLALHVITEQIGGYTNLEAALRDLIRLVRKHEDPDGSTFALFQGAEHEAARRITEQRALHPHGIYG